MMANGVEQGVRDGVALYDRGVACSTGSGGTLLDLVEAHKWFNLAAIGTTLSNVSPWPAWTSTPFLAASAAASVRRRSSSLRASPSLSA